jgi:hypothetical protein
MVYPDTLDSMPRVNMSDSNNKLDRVVAESLRQRDNRAQGYREKSLKMYPWICGRCAREFTRPNINELTVHHRDHNHDNNPEDGSNWELLCLYCHDNEHARQLEINRSSADEEPADVATFKPFSGLEALLKKEE